MKSADLMRLASIGVAVVVGGFVLKKLASGAVDAASNLADKVYDKAAQSAPVQGAANLIANAYLAVTLPGVVRLKSAVILPDSRQVPVQGLYIDSNLIFKYMGRFYQVIGRTPDGEQFVSVAVVA